MLTGTDTETRGTEVQTTLPEFTPTEDGVLTGTHTETRGTEVQTALPEFTPTEDGVLTGTHTETRGTDSTARVHPDRGRRAHRYRH